MTIDDMSPADLWGLWRERHPGAYSVYWAAVREIKRLVEDGVPNTAILEVMLRATEQPEYMLRRFDDEAIEDELECQLALVRHLWPEKMMPPAYFVYIDFANGAGALLPGLAGKLAAAEKELREICDQSLGDTIFNNRIGRAAGAARKPGKTDTTPRLRFVE